MLGASVAGYRIEAVAGRGGMGVVYLARQVALDRRVALKLIAPEFARDEAFRARFARESRIASSLDHPNVIPVYEAGEDGDRLFIAMRFVDGTDLGRMLAEDGALGPALAAELVAQAASALDAAHARGLVHRDVKPANLLVGGDLPARPHVYLTDFGLARRDGSSSALTTTGQWMGTPDYAAPEQIDGYDLDARTDVYALGCVLFAALTGTPPFGDRPRMAKAGAHLHEPPPALRSVSASVPAAFEPVVARALAKRPEDRYASAGELGAAALAAAQAPGATARTRRLRRGAAGGGPPVAASGARTARLTGRRDSGGPPGGLRPTGRRGSGAGARPRPQPSALALAAVLVVVVAAALAVALGAFSGGGKRPAPAAVHTVPVRPPGPPPADPSTGTVRCSSTSCSQRGSRVVPPIEGAPCRPQGRTGRWERIDADGQNPLFACTPDHSPPSGAPRLAAVPDLGGARLDNAERVLDRFGVRHDTSGGGVFGIIDSGNWTVCTTTPASGAPLAAGTSVKLYVDRSC
jgi:serine/threonine-protein kinase